MDNKIKALIEEKKPVVFKTVAVNMQFFDNIELVLSQILQMKNYQHLKTPLFFILKEIIENAHKSNLKRVFFNENGLDIFNHKDYEFGIEKFSNEVRDDPAKLIEKLKQSEKYVKVGFKDYSKTDLKIQIENNSKIVSQEKQRIKQKLTYFIENANSMDMFDQLEGAGMGLYLSLKMMDQIGIPPNSYSINDSDEHTISKIEFEYKSVNPPPYNEVTKQILDTIEKLPDYPHSIQKILDKLNQEQEVDFEDIANDLEHDPVLSADVLKLVNSAKFMVNRRIGSIKEALKIIGLKEIKSIIFSYGAMKTINERFGTIQEIWDHSYRVASISRIIAKKVLKKQNDDEFHSAGLLHDIGKIVLMSITKEQAEKIEQICRTKGIDMPIMEELMLGISHAKIGGEIAEFWHFPDTLVDAITHHHDPIMAEQNKDIVYTTFLANYLAENHHESTVTVHAIDFEVRDFFNFKTDADLINFIEKYRIRDYID